MTFAYFQDITLSPLRYFLGYRTLKKQQYMTGNTMKLYPILLLLICGFLPIAGVASPTYDAFSNYIAPAVNGELSAEEAIQMMRDDLEALM